MVTVIVYGKRIFEDEKLKKYVLDITMNRLYYWFAKKRSIENTRCEKIEVGG